MYGDERGLARHAGRGIVRFNFWRFESNALIAVDKSILSLPSSSSYILRSRHERRALSGMRLPP